MNKNIIILIFLGLMVAAAVFSIRSYNKLENEKKAKQELLTRNADLLSRVDDLTKELSLLQAQADSSGHSADSNWDTAAIKLIRQFKTVSEKYTEVNNLPALKQAEQLEKEAFEALTKNDFELALQKISLAEKTSPGFHMCYEISQLLNQNRKQFNDPESQTDIKKLILQKYSWKAPADLVRVLKIQVKNADTKTSSPVIKDIKWPVKKNY